MLKRVDLGSNKNLFIVSAVFVTGIGGLTLNFGSNPTTGGPLLTITSLATALIMGIITNLVVNEGRLISDDDPDGITAAVANMSEVDVEDLDQKEEGSN